MNAGPLPSHPFPLSRRRTRPMSPPRTQPSRFKARFAACEYRRRHSVERTAGDAGQGGTPQMLPGTKRRAGRGKSKRETGEEGQEMRWEVTGGAAGKPNQSWQHFLASSSLWGFVDSAIISFSLDCVVIGCGGGCVCNPSRLRLAPRKDRPQTRRTANTLRLHHLSSELMLPWTWPWRSVCLSRLARVPRASQLERSSD